MRWDKKITHTWGLLHVDKHATGQGQLGVKGIHATGHIRWQLRVNGGHATGEQGKFPGARGVESWDIVIVMWEIKIKEMKKV